MPWACPSRSTWSPDSPAGRLYERCGFVPVPGDGIHVLMERPPTNQAAAQPNTAT